MIRASTVQYISQYSDRVHARHSERLRLDDFLRGIREGHSPTLLLDGEAGVGKSTLLRYVAEQADDMRLFVASGTRSEVGIDYAALHRLCSPLFDDFGTLPVPQREALEIAFGLRTGPSPNALLLGLGVLRLLTNASSVGPVLCVIDDAQWLDAVSAPVFGFVARRLTGRVGILFATGAPSSTVAFDSIPRLNLRNLEPSEAETFLTSLVQARIDRPALNRIINETRGNPRSITESARGLSKAEISSGLIFPAIPMISSPSTPAESHFRDLLASLPAATRRFLLLAAAEPAGDMRIVRSAAASLGLDPYALGPAVDARLCDPFERFRFRHPLARVAVYRSAAPAALREAHAALAEVVGENADPALHTWHRAQSCDRADEAIANDLAALAQGFLARGFKSAGAAVLRQALRVTGDTQRRAEWVLQAAQAEIAAGEWDLAAYDIASISWGRLDAPLRAEAVRIEARVAVARNPDNGPVGLLLDTAEQLASSNMDSAREIYLEALYAAVSSGRQMITRVDEVSVRWRKSAVTAAEKPEHHLLDAMLRVAADRDENTRLSLQHTLTQVRLDARADSSSLRWVGLASMGALLAWNLDAWRTFSSRHLEFARADGDYSELPLALASQLLVRLLCGELASATEYHREMAEFSSPTSTRLTSIGAIGIAAVQGRVKEFHRLLQLAEGENDEGIGGTGEAIAYWGAALLHNSLGQYENAYIWALRSSSLRHPLRPSTIWTLAETIEAASRMKSAPDVTVQLDILRVATLSKSNSWGLGILARSRALVSSDADAEELYREAVWRLGATGALLDTARAALLYGEWLRRRRRLSDARQQLRTSLRLFEQIGAEAFADRARREIRAADAQSQKSHVGPSATLTAQEAEIARLAGQGLTNREVATRMFLSPRTVEYHLAKVFTKLRVKSRHQLTAVIESVPVVSVLGGPPRDDVT